MNQNRTTKGIKTMSIALASLIYTSAVIYGDIQFISVMAQTFPESGIMRALALAGAIMTAASAIVIPIALHYWLSPGPQLIWGYIFWTIDLAALSLNSILAYSIATGTPDPWLQSWQLLSPATPLFAVFGWGIIFMLDPSQKRRHADMELEADLIDLYIGAARKAAGTNQFTEIIATGVLERAHTLASDLASNHIGTNGNRDKETAKTQPVNNRPKAKTKN